MSARNILVVDDNHAFLQDLCNYFDSETSVTHADSIDQCRRSYAPHRFDLVVLDVRLESSDEGLDLLKEIIHLDPLQPVAIITAYADDTTYLRAIREGALMFIDKNSVELDTLAQILSTLGEHGHLRRREARAQEEIRRIDPLNLIGASTAAQSLIREVERASASPSAIYIIEGEIGSGRELTARTILARNKQATISLPPTTIQTLGRSPNELNALLPSTNDHPAPCSIIVKEVEKLPNSALKNISNSWRLTLDSPLFLITSGLSQQTEQEFFPQATRISVPPLRDRIDDIPLLGSYFVETLRRQSKPVPTGISPEALTALKEYSWPANISELKTCIEYAGLLASEEGTNAILKHHLPHQIIRETKQTISIKPFDLDYQIAKTHLELANNAAEQTIKPTKDKIAKTLGIKASTTLDRRIKKFIQQYPELKKSFPQATELFAPEQKVTP